MTKTLQRSRILLSPSSPNPPGQALLLLAVILGTVKAVQLGGTVDYVHFSFVECYQKAAEQYLLAEVTLVQRGSPHLPRIGVGLTLWSSIRTKPPGSTRKSLPSKPNTTLRTVTAGCGY